MTTAEGLTLPARTAAGEEWLALAFHLAEKLRATAAERDRNGAAPREEVEDLRRSGLLTLLDPAEFGGAGLTFDDAFRVVRVLSEADANIGQLLSYHYLLSHSAFWRAGPAQAAALHRASVAGRWFWGGASNPRDPISVLSADGDGFRLNGRKSFASNAALADRLTQRCAFGDRILLLALPARAEGIHHAGDWDAFGQKLTESGGIEFRDVRVERAHIVGAGPEEAEPVLPPRTTLIVPLHQLFFVNIYLGTARGALAEAAHYIRNSARPWTTSGVAAASEDPYILEHYGHFDADLRAGTALADQAAAQIGSAIERGDALTQSERDAAAATIYAAKVFASRTALAVTSGIFDLMGARATANRYGFDRFWRNIRTHTLHDPIAYKAREVANYALNGRITSDPLYS